MLEKNIFFGVYGSFIPHRPFIQYFSYACECGKLEQAEDFINKYSVKLHEEHRKQVTNRCLAQLHIFRNNFDKALELLKDYNSDDITEIIDLKMLQSMIYYELSLYDNLDYTIDSSIKMIKANKFISDAKRSSLMIFFKYAKKLGEIRQKKEEIEASVLLKIILRGEYFILHYWLTGKLKEIEKK